MASFAAGLARVLSKLGFCSRAQARELIRAGRVRVNGTVVRDPDAGVAETAFVEVDGQQIGKTDRIYVMLNKPRGLMTTTVDEQGRETVYVCFKGASLPRIVPVGRLDKASEGLLLFTNDTDWAAKIADPESRLPKTYHVQINCLADEALLAAIKMGSEFRVKDARMVRLGARNSWLEIVLDEGKNRHIRRLLEALGIEVLRLIRIQIGGLELGDLPKGQWRHLTRNEHRRIFTR